MAFILQNVKVVAWAGFDPAHAIELLTVKVLTSNFHYPREIS